MNQNEIYRKIAELDRIANSYGYDSRFGLAAADIEMSRMVSPASLGGPAASQMPVQNSVPARSLPPGLLARLQRGPVRMDAPLQRMDSVPAARQIIPSLPQNTILPMSALNMGGVPTNYSINPAIAAATAGASTFQLSITCTQATGGAVGAYFPIFLFGSSAYTNCNKGYTSVQNAGQVTGTSFTNGKNCITFTYADPANPTHTSTYTVSLTTQGEYPLALNSLSGRNSYTVRGIQMYVSDVAQTAQLNLAQQTFTVNQFGTVLVNDLTTPPDLYQQSDKGVYIPHEFPISDREGFTTNVLNVANFTVSYYFYVTRN